MRSKYHEIEGRYSMKDYKDNNDFYREEIRRLIEETDDTHALCCTYTTILTHLQILAEKGGTA